MAAHLLPEDILRFVLRALGPLQIINAGKCKVLFPHSGREVVGSVFHFLCIRLLVYEVCALTE